LPPSAEDARAQAEAEEARRIRLLRLIVDLTGNVLLQGGLSRAEADALVAATRARVLELFPDKEDVYELILAPRFSRMIAEFATAPPRRP
jgi:hypothetical protein